MSECVDIIGNHVFGVGERKGCICKPKQVKLKPFSSEFLMEVWVLAHPIFILKIQLFPSLKRPENNDQADK